VVGPYMVVGYQLEVANDIFNSRRDCPISSSCHVVLMRGMAPCCQAAWLCSGALRAARRCTVEAEQSPVSMSCWYLMHRPQHALWDIMAPSVHTSGRYLGNTRVHLGNVRAFLYLLLMAHRRSQNTRFSGALVRRATGFRAQCHVMAPELTCWAQSCGTRGGSGAPLPPRAERRGSGAVGRVAVPEPAHLGSRDLELRDSWRRVDACPVPGPNLEFVRRGT
jgi:hypothetical protein